MKWLCLAVLVLAGCAHQKSTKAEAPETALISLGDEIILPQNQEDALTFVRLARRKENQKLVRLPSGTPITKMQKHGGPAVFWFNSSPESYMVYRDDLNNDGSLEYLVVILDMGSGEHGGVYGAYYLKGKKLISLNFEENVIRSLFPGQDSPQLALYLARPFAIRSGGKQYIRFLISTEQKQEVGTFLWEGEQFKRVKGKFESQL